MKVLIAATALTGHINPLLAVGRRLTARGDDVVVMTAERFRTKIEASGLRFAPYDDGDAAEYRETALPAGPERYRIEFARRFIDPIPLQTGVLRTLIAAEEPDVIIAGSMMLGVLPLLLASDRRPPIIVLNVSFLFLDRPDQAPVGLGLPPARTEAERTHYALLKVGMDAAFADPVRSATDTQLARLGASSLPASLPHSIAVLPDLFLQPTVPAFEYDFGRLPLNLRFVGLLPAPKSEAPLPDWWHARDPAKPVVLVTQGTLANADFGELIEPTLAALADRDDLLVVVTTGGRPVEALEMPLPGNARAASFLPFDALLPQINLLVTNGGYGSVSQALAVGVPIVSAGLTEDKAEVGARIGWAGAGLNLATNTPTQGALRTAIDTVLGSPRFRARAAALARDFQGLDSSRQILDAIDEVVGVHAAVEEAVA
ncbi:glycosyltransferase [Methylobacterium komagatae]|uniref:Glycosyltransferase n=1 Tax=Methylobacterium komagatae TaxID=374425 RepID=A0ABW2BHQ6_9HYPH